MADTVGDAHEADPSPLTTAQLLREFTHLKELVEARMGGMDDSYKARLDAMDKAIVLLQEFPTAVDISVGYLKTLHEEKFRSVDMNIQALKELISTQFTERDTRTEKQATKDKEALDAALQAQKEAVGEQNKSNALAIDKSEAGFIKQIDATGALIESKTLATDDKLGDMKDRITAIESRTNGKAEGISTFGAIVLGVLAGLGSLAGVAGLILAISSKVT